MKKFQFRLQKLLQIRSHKKLECQKKLANAERVRRMEEGHLTALKHKFTDELINLKQNIIGKITAERLSRSIYYQHHLRSSMITQIEMIKKAKKIEEDKRKELLEASKKEKIFKKLKERQKTRYLNELDFNEQKIIDEVAVNSFLKKQ